jgi:anthranilate phosphoribosyltransferase
MQVMGVYDINLVEPLSRVLSNLGVKRGLVVYGLDHLDEISLCAPTFVCDFNDGEFNTYTIKPEDFGLVQSSNTALVSTTPEQSASITRDIFNGAKGPRRDIVLLNSGAGLYVAGKAASLAQGVSMAAELIDSGKAAAKLDEFIKTSHGV